MGNKISVVIPVYNVEQYLEDALHSVFEQVCSVDFEVVIINDGSTDNSKKIIESFSEKKGYVYIEQDNAGLSSARNRGIECSTGDYIIFFDSDDIMPPNALNSCISKLIGNNCNMVLFDAICIDEVGKQINNNSYRHSDVYGESHSCLPVRGDAYLSQALSMDNYIVSACLYMVKKSAIGSLRFEPGMLHEDNLFTTLLLVKKDIIVDVIQKNLFYRRVRRDSITTGRKSLKHVDGYLLSSELLLEQSRVSNVHIEKLIKSYVSKLLISAISIHSKTNIRFVNVERRKKLLAMSYRSGSLIAMMLSLIPEVFTLVRLFR
ncbi:putative Glycosyltransferase involved in cell wall bisynthesis [Vibrio chagasii]|nr:putative Glycosyltransferase involved in cell wall bisynthesis [Vibrio chagasii]CAH7476075.1 putative Glycosyltransferase involved in cell wall bisynthesis [Vibrio chagasii]